MIYITRSMESVRIKLHVLAKSLEADLVEVSPDTDDFDDINPKRIFPLLVSRECVLFGRALEEYLNERYPNPDLLHGDPARRASIRLLTDEVRSWYELFDATPEPDRDAIRGHITELEASYDPSKFWIVGTEQLTCIDHAVLALLSAAHMQNYWTPLGSVLDTYYHTLVRTNGLFLPARPAVFGLARG